MTPGDPTEDCSSDCGCHSIPRRDFIKLSGIAAASVAFGGKPLRRVGFVPEDKRLAPDWNDEILRRGTREEYRGDDLRVIGMPVGGICAGEVLLGGDGQLWLWDIFNQIKFGLVEKTIQYNGRSLSAGDGANYMESPDQVHPFLQGFAMETRSSGNAKVRQMNRLGWKDISFIGEYPIGYVKYRDADSPVQVDLETFSPYVPLESENSGLPCVIQRFTIKNVSQTKTQIRFGGWLENAVCLHTLKTSGAIKVNRFAQEAGLARIDCEVRENPKPTSSRPDILFEDFEKPTYEGWTVAGNAFGPGPIERSKMPSYQDDVGGHGKRVACSYNARNGETIGQGDRYTGRLTSREFEVRRRYVGFLIGGGNHPGTTCLNLVVDGKVVRTATGKNREQMDRASFEVVEFLGKSAHIEIVDEEGGGWGHITVDDILFSDHDPAWAPLAERPDFGTISLAALHPQGSITSRHRLSPDNVAEALFESQGAAEREAKTETADCLVSGLVQEFALAPGEVRTLTFAWTWNFPNLVLNKLGRVGNHYSTRFKTSGEVARHVEAGFESLYAKTQRWHDTWYDSSLPYWLLDRVMGNNATLATMTSVRFGNGRFYGWEGIGCCEGTCGHVWAYAQGPARLFPDLERSVREMVDFGIAFHPDTGIIEFRGEFGNGYATDAQGGYVLRTYREHQMSKDWGFLKRVYPRAKKALQYLIEQDGNQDGIIENAQHNTLDIDLYGASSWLSSIYLSALRAGEQMATEIGDHDFASQCRRIAEDGLKNVSEQLWNGEYFIQRLDLKTHPDALRYGDGCEVDQAMGQWWSWQLGLPRVLDESKTKAALAALYRNNFLTDVGPFREKEKAGRWYAAPGEAGLLICTFPKGDKSEILGNGPVWASMYFNECMTGFEYEAAGHMVAEGLVREGMTVTRAVHDRYIAKRRNPWNEVECSDHYARCMAVHGVFIAACGFEYHGPKGHLGFAPKISPDKFKAPFNAAEGWGTYSQTILPDAFIAEVSPKYGWVGIETLGLELPEGFSPQTCEVTVGGQRVAGSLERADRKAIVRLASRRRVAAGESLVARLS